MLEQVHGSPVGPCAPSQQQLYRCPILRMRRHIEAPAEYPDLLRRPLQHLLIESARQPNLDPQVTMSCSHTFSAKVPQHAYDIIISTIHHIIKLGSITVPHPAKGSSMHPAWCRICSAWAGSWASVTWCLPSSELRRQPAPKRSIACILPTARAGTSAAGAGNRGLVSFFQTREISAEVALQMKSLQMPESSTSDSCNCVACSGLPLCEPGILAGIQVRFGQFKSGSTPCEVKRRQLWCTLPSPSLQICKVCNHRF